eukprot:5830959-Prymnesium_polylepis.1
MVNPSLGPALPKISVDHMRGRPQRAPTALLHAQMLTTSTVHHKDGVVQRWLAHHYLAHHGVHDVQGLARVISCNLPAAQRVRRTRA